MILTNNYIFIFDLDDTLYSEREFEKSGIEFVYKYFEITNIHIDILLNNRKNWINLLLNDSGLNIKIDQILDIYQNHIPNIQLYKDSFVFLQNLLSLGVEMSLITDGRSKTQRNKIKALGIESYFKHIVISDEIKSEKPSEYNFKIIMNDCNSKNYVYIADNPEKDFLTPNKFGWTTVCLLDRGDNIHKQDFNKPKEFLPQFIINSFEEITILNGK